jgi:hypothetical protein
MGRRKKGMEIGEATVIGASRHPGGTHELKLKAFCPSDCERANVQLAGRWVAADLERGGHGMVSRAFVVTIPDDPQLAPGTKVPAEFFYPGEQAGVHSR